MENPNILVLRTNVQDELKKRVIEPLLNQHPDINEWSIDMEDLDKVLRIETSSKIQEEDIVQLLNQVGLLGEDLDRTKQTCYEGR